MFDQATTDQIPAEWLPTSSLPVASGIRARRSPVPAYPRPTLCINHRAVSIPPPDSQRPNRLIRILTQGPCHYYSRCNPGGSKRVSSAMMTDDDCENLSRHTDHLPMETKHAQNPPIGRPMDNGYCTYLKSPARVGLKKRVDALQKLCSETLRQHLTCSLQIPQLIPCNA